MYAIEALVGNNGEQWGARLLSTAATDVDFGILPLPMMMSAITIVIDGAIVKVQLTRSPWVNIVEGNAEWFDWALGDIDGTGAPATASDWISMQHAMEVTGFRTVNVDGSVIASLDVYAWGAQGADRAGNVRTPEGGLVTLKTWAGPAASVYGELCQAVDTGEYEIANAAASSPVSIGVAYDTGCPVDGICPIVVSGDAEVLLVDGVGSVLGNLCVFDAAVDGRMNTAAPPVAADWSAFNSWIGQALETVAGGADHLAAVRLRF